MEGDIDAELSTGPVESAQDRPRRSLARDIRSRPFLVTLAASIVVVLGLAYILRGGLDAIGPSLTGSRTSTPADAVRGFLQALSDHDASAALSYAAQPPPDTTLLTDDVLKATVQPFTKINVEDPAVSDDSFTAHVEFRAERADSGPLRSALNVVRVGPSWLVTDVTATLSRDRGQEDVYVPWYVDGTLVSTDSVSVFLGSHTQSTHSDYLQYSVEDFQVTAGEAYPSGWNSTIRPTSAALKAAGQTAPAAFAKCLQQKRLDPAGCGFAALPPDDGSTVVASTIQWKVEKGTEFADWDFTAATTTTIAEGLERLICTGTLSSGEPYSARVYVTSAVVYFDVDGVREVLFRQ